MIWKVPKRNPSWRCPLLEPARNGESIQLTIDDETKVHLYPLKVTKTPLLGLYKVLRHRENEKH